MFWYDSDHSAGSIASDLHSDDTSYDDDLSEGDPMMEMTHMEEAPAVAICVMGTDHVMQGDGQDVVEAMLASPAPHLDARTMTLSDQEREWAKAIREAVQTDEELTPLSDFEYAHYALISKGDTRNALMRARALQAFRQEYQVDDSVEQGLYMMGELMRQQEGLLLGLDVDSTTLEGLHVMDIGKLNSEVAMGINPLHTYVDYNWRIFVCGYYYYLKVVQPCLTTIRVGTYTMADFHNWGWKHMNMEIQYRFSGEMFAQYPMDFSKFLAFNTNSVANMIWSLLKKVYPPSLLGKLQLGCQVSNEGQIGRGAITLAEKWLLPTVDDAYQRMLTRAKDLLVWRRRNEELFRL